MYHIEKRHRYSLRHTGTPSGTQELLGIRMHAGVMLQKKAAKLFESLSVVDSCKSDQVICRRNWLMSFALSLLSI
jgi:hypothetical protein